MIKIIACSFYNCLIDKEGAISRNVMIQIDALRNKNKIFAIVSNRDINEILEYNKDFPFIDYIIAFNGSYVYDVIEKKCIYKSKISTTNLKKIATIFEHCKMIVYTENGISNSINIDSEEEVYKVEIEIDKEESKEKLNKVNVNASILTYDDKMYLEITSSKSDTFTAIDKIGLKSNVSLKEILAVGSNESDIPLIQHIPNSFIVDIATSSLTKNAKKKPLSLSSILENDILKIEK